MIKRLLLFSCRLSRYLKRKKGYSLIELMTALILTGILASSFLGIMVQFSRVNQKSRTVLLATAAANNQFEKLKSLSLSELALQPSGIRIKEDHFYLQTDLELYLQDGQKKPDVPNVPGSSTGLLDLVIKSSENGFASYLIADSLQNITSLTGTGLLHVRLAAEAGGVLIQLSDDYGKNAVFHFSTSSQTSIFNIHTQQMNKSQQVLIELDPSLAGDWQINVFEQPFSYGNIQLTYKNSVYQTNQQLKKEHSDGLSIQTHKQEQRENALVYLQVKAYINPEDEKPVSSCQGIIKAPY